MTYTDEFLSYVRRFRTFRDYGLTVTEVHDLVSYYDGDSSDENTLYARVSYVLRNAPNFGLAPGFAIMSFELVDDPTFEVGR